MKEDLHTLINIRLDPTGRSSRGLSTQFTVLLLLLL